MKTFNIHTLTDMMVTLQKVVDFLSINPFKNQAA